MESCRTTAEELKENKSKKIVKFTSYTIDNTRFDLPNYYGPIKALGRGAYGVVCSAYDRSTGERVAIKKTTNPFTVPQIAKCLCREIQILKFFNHNNIVKLKNILNPLSKNLMQDVIQITKMPLLDLPCQRVHGIGFA